MCVIVCIIFHVFLKSCDMVLHILSSFSIVLVNISCTISFHFIHSVSSFFMHVVLFHFSFLLSMFVCVCV